MADEQHDATAAGRATSGTTAPEAGPSGCQFPTGPGGQTCGRPIEQSGGPGAPARYCDLPAHNRAKAFAARRSYALAAAGGPGSGRADGVEGPGAGVEALERPVTDGRASFGALLAQFGDVAGQARRVLDEQQGQLGAILARAEEVVRTVADPEAAAFEVEQVQRETGVRIAEAQSAQASAERDAREARRRAEQEAEQRAQADDAAETALRELETVRVETAETIARITAETDARVAEQTARAEQAVAEQAAAREELDRVRAQAAEDVTAARTAAEEYRREVEADRDRRLAERAQAAREEIEQARTEITETARQQVAAAETRAAAAEQTAETARREAAEAVTARTRAEADTAAAERRADDDRATVEQLRAELAAVRREAAEERAALRQEARDQLAAVLTQLGTPTRPGSGAGDPAEQTATRDPAPRRGRGKTTE
ncbi:MAG: hypothetical protein J0I49_34075 [Pseudonocardia sp.]|jgi:colicin import membrane protein|uniref:hypothetical protein n=1 Tax=Pseudonocardia sp. TaxID=60912 RepID=UPI001AC7F6A0|nr:hypothetical protein [Pseudonocardia sp.]MBN9103085.1 hypothetical protein [Pseudonocardia sp.]